MNGFLASHSQYGALPSVDPHLAAGDGAQVKAADCIEVEEALVVYVDDLQAELVHVAGQHDPRLAFLVVGGNGIAVHIYPDFVRIACHLVLPDLAYRSLVA